MEKLSIQNYQKFKNLSHFPNEQLIKLFLSIPKAKSLGYLRKFDKNSLENLLDDSPKHLSEQWRTALEAEPDTVGELMQPAPLILNENLSIEQAIKEITKIPKQIVFTYGMIVDDNNKHLLKEVTAASAVGAFTGRAGDYIDQKFAGAFHPEFGELEDLLKLQVDSDIIKRMYTDDVTPMAEQDWFDVDWEYEYTPVLDIDNSKFKNTSETEMQLVDIEVKYDKIEDKTEENKNS